MTTLIQTQTTVYPQPRPAGMGDQCEEYYRNPLILDSSFPEEGVPLLVRCKDQAARRLVLNNDGDVYTTKFCDHHYGRLKCQIEAGVSLVEILEDKELGDHR